MTALDTPIETLGHVPPKRPSASLTANGPELWAAEFRHAMNVLVRSLGYQELIVDTLLARQIAEHCITRDLSYMQVSPTQGGMRWFFISRPAWNSLVMANIIKLDEIRDAGNNPIDSKKLFDEILYDLGRSSRADLRTS